MRQSGHPEQRALWGKVRKGYFKKCKQLTILSGSESTGGRAFAWRENKLGLFHAVVDTDTANDAGLSGGSSLSVDTYGGTNGKDTVGSTLDVSCVTKCLICTLEYRGLEFPARRT